MCGIAGIVSVNPNEVSLAKLKSMTASIAHRGPDGEGQWINEEGKVGLAHRRLSIIDLSNEAAQPMHYHNRYSLVFNGEIYNYIELRQTLQKEGYAFHTSSDTEVLMALYDKHGVKCLQLLDGMFAFALYDKEAHQLFCARDRFGEKPFHYAYKRGQYFQFASEMKALWAAGIPKSVNNRMLYGYLRYNLLQNPTDTTETFYEGILRLNPSHYALVNTQTFECSTFRYWDINLTTKQSINLEEASQRFRQLFFTSITRRLRSDVPIGSSLSGGLDSSAVVCAIDFLNTDKKIVQKTFSAQFPGFEKDESYFQKLVIDKTKAYSHIISPNAASLIEYIDTVAYHQEEPFGSASILAQYEVFQSAKRNGVTVLLDGQGADEYLAGYHPYFKYFFLEIEKETNLFQHQQKTYFELHSNNNINSLFKRDAKYLLQKKVPFLFNWSKKLKYTLTENERFFNKDFYDTYKGNILLNFKTPTNLNEGLYQSLMCGEMQDLLRYADRNSMAHSLEVRLPFLNHELVEFVFGLPATFKINEGWTKFIMRNALKDILPSEITWRKDKIGYEPPQKKWMEQPKVQEIIMEQKKKLANAGIIKQSEAQKPVAPTGALQADILDWKYWMAGKLFASK